MSGYIKPDMVQAIAHSVDIPKLTPDAAKALAPDVEYRMREVVQEALKFARHAKRLKLTAEDVNLALRLRNVEPVHGLSSRDPSKFVRVAGHAELFYVRDREKGYAELVEGALPRVPLEVGVSAHWLAIGGVQPRVPENAPLDQVAAAPPTKRARRGAAAAAQASRGDAGDAGARQASGLLSARAALHAPPLAAPVSALDGGVAVLPPVRHALSQELRVYFDKVAQLVDNPAPDTAAALPDALAALGARRSDAGTSAAAASAPSAADAASTAHAALLRGALASLSTDPGLHPLAPYFAALIAEGVPRALSADLPRLSRLLALARALLSNPHLHLGPYLAQLLPPLLTCVVSRALGGVGGGDDAVAASGVDQWAVRRQAAAVVALAARRYGEPYHNVAPRVTGVLCRALRDACGGGGSAAAAAPPPPGALASAYGAVVGLAALGHATVRAKLLPLLEPLVVRALLPAMEASGAGSARQRGDAWRVYGAAAEAAAGAVYGRLMGGVERGLPDAAVLRALRAAARTPAKAPADVLPRGSSGGAGAKKAVAARRSSGGGGKARGKGRAAAAGDAMDVDDAEAEDDGVGGTAARVRAVVEADDSVATALADAWRDDSDAGAVVDALVALFGETFLAGMPLADLPTHFL